MPRGFRFSWGADESVLRADFDAFNAQMMHEFSKLHEQFNPESNRVEWRFNLLESRFDKLESKFDGLDAKIDGLQSQVDRLQGQVQQCTKYHLWLLALTPFLVPKDFFILGLLKTLPRTAKLIVLGDEWCSCLLVVVVLVISLCREVVKWFDKRR